jgi:quinolinate synthetase A subunit
MNSSADIKAFTGRQGGAICTSSNAATAMRWAFSQRDKVLFLPDQHLGRNTALAMGLDDDDLAVWNPHQDNGGLTDEAIARAKVLLWRGHCSVHQRFQAEMVDAVRARVPGVNVIVHPECRREVVERADVVGSTETIIRTIGEAPAGSKWAVGTELNLVERLDLPNGEHAYVECARAHHHHVICSSCGRTTEVEGCGMQAVADEVARRSGYQIDGHRLELFGLCPRCVAAGMGERRRPQA